MKKNAWWEYVVRFLFGGLITVGAGLVLAKFGATVGGLFLAFPAILPASLTLVMRHDGRARAIDDARGACVGAIGLGAFALVVAATATAWSPALVLVAATVAWAFVSGLLWTIVFARRGMNKA